MHIASLRIVHDRVMLAILCGRIGSIFRVAERAGIPIKTLRNLAEYAIPLDADARERLLKLNREVMAPKRRITPLTRAPGRGSIPLEGRSWQG